MDRNEIRASLADLDEAAERWDRAAEICEKRGNQEGASTFRANADTADTCRKYLAKYAGTAQEGAVRRQIHAKISACASAEQRETLRDEAHKHRGTMRGLIACMKLAAWSQEDADRVYAEMRKDRRIQDQLKASRQAPGTASAGTVTDLRAARAARRSRAQAPGRVPAARASITAPAASDPDLASFLRGA